MKGKKTNKKNNVLAVTNEKLHAWSASCDSDLSWRNKKWAMIPQYFILQYQILHILKVQIFKMNECKLVHLQMVLRKTQSYFEYGYCTYTKGLNTYWIITEVLATPPKTNPPKKFE